MSKSIQNEWLTAPQLYGWLALGRTTVYALLQNGDIPSYRLGRKIMVRRQDVEAWLENHRHQPGS